MIFLNEKNIPEENIKLIETEKDFLKLNIDIYRKKKSIILYYMQNFANSTALVDEDFVNSVLSSLEDLKSSLELCNENIANLDSCINSLDNIIFSIQNNSNDLNNIFKSFNSDYCELNKIIIDNALKIEDNLCNISKKSELNFEINTSAPVEDNKPEDNKPKEDVYEPIHVPFNAEIPMALQHPSSEEVSESAQDAPHEEESNDSYTPLHEKDSEPVEEPVIEQKPMEPEAQETSEPVIAPKHLQEEPSKPIENDMVKEEIFEEEVPTEEPLYEEISEPIIDNSHEEIPEPIEEDFKPHIYEEKIEATEPENNNLDDSTPPSTVEEAFYEEIPNEEIASTIGEKFYEETSDRDVNTNHHIENSHVLVKDKPYENNKENTEKSKDFDDIIPNSYPNDNIRENTLIISEMSGKVVLPYTIPELKEVLMTYPDKFSSLEQVIEEKYTLPISMFKNPVVSRFKEAFKLIRDREHGSVSDAFELGIELMFNYNLHPAVIAACKSLDDLDIYTDYLEKNATGMFSCFDIVFETPPAVSKKKNNKEF